MSKQIIVLKSDNVAYFDVDETLVNTSVTNWNSSMVEIENNGIQIYCSINQEVVEQMIKHKARGHYVVVWSQGGYQWALNVVEALGLKEYVDLIISKPKWFYDNLPSSQFMPEINRMWKGD